MSDNFKSSDLASFGEVVPVGTYTAKLTKLESKEAESAEGANFVTLGLEILDTESEGLTCTAFIFPKVTKSKKNGKLYSRGIYEAQAFAAAWGSPLPDFPLDEFMGNTTIKGARMLQKLLGDSYKKAGGPRLKIRVVAEKVQAKDEASDKWVDKKDDEGNQVYRNKTLILGRATATPNGAVIKADEAADDAGSGETLTFV